MGKKKLRGEVAFWKEVAQSNSDMAMDAINKQHEQHERQMQVAEKEIERLNTIIDFLYMRGRE